MSKSAEDILEFIDFTPMTLDDIVSRSGLDTDTLFPHLLTLEMVGEIELVPSGQYKRIGKASDDVELERKFYKVQTYNVHNSSN